MSRLSLLRQGSPLSDTARQVEVLEHACHRPFSDALADSGHWPLRATGIQVLQVNVGKLCNQTCRHCHVDAGPDRTEVMTRETMQLCLDVLADADIPTLDVTGGAPELNPNFRWLVEEARALGRHVIDRCNLTILLAPRFEDLPEFLARHRVEVVASLPCYLSANTDRQRGDGVFDRSIEALRRLNSLGYGYPDGPPLTLVYNPLGPSLPPPQPQLEAAYHRELATRYGVAFTQLFTITNMPISRFLDDLLQSGRFDEYMHKLTAAYNPAAASGVMCRTTLSVNWDGRLSDCDFNQMLDLGLSAGLPHHIRDFDSGTLANRRIVTGQHCYGCTAGSGSGCQGAIVS
ncbi:MAG TPA: arsenosugar biosynthesis radical SAM (seleno)protein ArsS [Fimbriiglobus sp.]|jgi:radical SAM/Cys-rich protein|nr:arsenosugar biosynthesis radical SAM (seleno)protein ArsS [Fimbriiglobus sp.]